MLLPDPDGPWEGGVGRWATCTVYRFKHSARLELLLQEVTLAALASAAKFSCTLDELLRDNF